MSKEHEVKYTVEPDENGEYCATCSCGWGINTTAQVTLVSKAVDHKVDGLSRLTATRLGEDK